MFSKELENLIQATLEDGKLEQYEKDALVKRAQAEGVDLTELEIYINSILQKRQRELENEKKAAYAKAEKKKKEEFGRVCPNCGRQVQSMTLKCECGYEFNTQRNVSAMQRLSEELSKVSLSRAEEKEIEEEAPASQNAKRETILVNKRIAIISNFAVPNTKEDLLEFLAVSATNANKPLGFFEQKQRVFKMVLIGTFAIAIFGVIIFGDIVGMILCLPFIIIGLVLWGTRSFAEEKLQKTWKAKCEQVILKGHSMRGDAEFTQQVNYYESLLNKKD